MLVVLQPVLETLSRWSIEAQTGGLENALRCGPLSYYFKPFFHFYTAQTVFSTLFSAALNLRDSFVSVTALQSH